MNAWVGDKSANVVCLRRRSKKKGLISSLPSVDRRNAIEAMDRLQTRFKLELVWYRRTNLVGRGDYEPAEVPTPARTSETIGH